MRKWHMTAAAVIAALTIGLVGVPAPTASAGGFCSVASKTLGNWVKASKQIKYASAFGTVAGVVAKAVCKQAVDNLIAGLPAMIGIDDGDGNQTPPERITFDDLKLMRLPTYKPRTVFVDPPAYYDYACSGYRFKAFRDQCMQDRLGPLWD